MMSIAKILVRAVATAALATTTTTTKMTTSNKKRIGAALLDLSGTLHVGKTVVEGAVDAVQRLRAAGIRVRFLTNTSKVSTQELRRQLVEMGFLQDSNDAEDDLQLQTSVLATRAYLLKHQLLRPYCLMEDASDLTGAGGISSNGPPPYDCVVVGLAPSKLNYENLNQAFRVLVDSSLDDNKDIDDKEKKQKPLIAIHKGKYQRDTDNLLSLGPGPFVSALEMAAGVEAVVMGKPSKEFFDSALFGDVPPSETVVVGDDVLTDVVGGIKNANIGYGVLVRTGKYRPGDEDALVNAVNLYESGDARTTICCDSIVEAVDYILEEGSYHSL